MPKVAKTKARKPLGPTEDTYVVNELASRAQQALRRCGVAALDEQEMGDWLRIARRPLWLEADPPEEARWFASYDKYIEYWVRFGVRTPDRRPAGLRFEAARAAVEAGGRGASADWAGAEEQCVRALATLIAARRGTTETVALGKALSAARGGVTALHLSTNPRVCGDRFTDTCCCRRPRSVADDAALVAYRAEDLNWMDLAQCLTAGLALDEAIEHVREGRDMEAVRVMAALA